MIKSLVLLCLLVAVVRPEKDFCWRDSYGRGVGKPLHVCAPGLEKNGALCYPPCKAGYYGVGPVCWAHCPSDMKDTGAQCQKDSYGRGAGKPLHTCRSDQEKNGALCYPKCQKDHYGVGPVCWQHCPKDYHDDGMFCRKDVHIYGKGCCCTIWGCCGNSCQKGYESDPCTCRRNAHIFGKHTHGRGAGSPMGCADNEEQNGALCYPKPKPNYKGVGPVVWQNCHGETIDFGAFCTKKTYGRGAGVPMICDPIEDWDAALCYKKCDKKYHGVGPVCWGDCPPNWSSCGAGCAKSSGDCAGKIIDMVFAPAAMVANLAATVVTVGGSAVATQAAKAAAKTAEKVAKIAKKSIKIGQKIAHYAKDVFTQGNKNGKTMTQEEANDLAHNTINNALSHVGVGGDDDEPAWEKALDVVETVDPTGVMSAAKAFIHPLCHTFF